MASSIRLECIVHGVTNYWTCEVRGGDTLVTYGTVGIDDSVEELRNHGKADAAEAFLETMKVEKYKEGYVTASGVGYDSNPRERSAHQSMDTGVEEARSKDRDSQEHRFLIEETGDVKGQEEDNEKAGGVVDEVESEEDEQGETEEDEKHGEQALESWMHSVEGGHGGGDDPQQTPDLMRPMWFPVVVESEQGPAKGSRFNGLPWLPEGDPWPTCAECNNPMQLMLQLDMTILPAPLLASKEFGDDGLLQAFMCMDDGDDCSNHEAFSGANLVRMLTGVQLSSGGLARVNDGSQEINPPARITGWEGPEDDYPNSEERESILDALGIAVSDDDGDDGDARRRRILEDAPDKLAGYPQWVRDVDYPNCRRCDTVMKNVFQISAEENVPYTFGDCGRGHITQCPVHKDELAFSWSCSMML